MNDMNAYQDILKEIELWEIRLGDLQHERRYLIKKMNVPPQVNLCANYSGMPGSGMMVINLPEYWDRVREIDQKIEECYDVLSLKREAQRNMEKVMSQMHRLEYRVAYMRDVEKLKLKEIAEKLSFSEGWIRQVSMRVPRIRTKEKIPS